MIKEIYKNSPILGVIKPYLSMSDSEIEALSNKEKELLNYYNNTICIK
jgi:hypothetical protein|tara:strand:- start:482 stop:625 length:144 start_codon:yes stop_codon:yes gene_type:complete